MFESILGNEPVKAYLRGAIAEERLPHALLFSGPAGIGKSLFAQELAAELLKTPLDRIAREAHPDFHPLRPEGKSAVHSIDSLRRLIDNVHAAPFEGQAKVFVIYDADRMQPAAANALLKTLEEPCSLTILILITSFLQEILPTIYSRCSPVRFQPLSEEDIAKILQSKGLLEKYSLLAQGSVERACALAERPALEELLFPLFEKKHSYAEFSIIAEEIEERIEEEDPLKHVQNMEYLFASILMWHRDQLVKRLRVPQAKLFFPSAPKANWQVPDLSEIIKQVDEARLAVSRNIRFSSCLEKIFCSI